DVMQILEDKAKAIRGDLGRVVAKQLRIVPELAFFEDTTLDYAQHIDDVLARDPVRPSSEEASDEESEK
ncbi:MAG: ribosome-binding factor A, partial [Bacteroidales bacterium]|nr:ribosome-binding factor A [Bacteroidales bacterium]